MTTTLDLRPEWHAQTDDTRIRTTIDGREYVFLFTRLPQAAAGAPCLMRRTDSGCWSVTL